MVNRSTWGLSHFRLTEKSVADFPSDGKENEAMKSLDALNKKVVRCRACPRLVDWREQVAVEKRAMYMSDSYWGRAVPGFGDPVASIMIVGLAPGAHGANRTGRMFTGDRSGDWLYGALHRAGLANQPESTGREDGLELDQVYITNIVRCVPPLNKPTTEERNHCLPYFEQEMQLLQNLKVFITLGSFAWNGCVRILAEQGHVVKPKPKFGHAEVVKVGPYTLVGSYHPSQQNTFTGKLTEPMFNKVFKLAKKHAGIS
jgi:uracil-DNA glycosylase family 4